MIIIENLTKYYGSKIALKDISLTIKRGEIVGLLGADGAGKSTLMKIIASVLPPSSGTVTIIRHDTVSESLQARKCIGYLPENACVYPEMRVEAFLRFVAGMKGVKRRAIPSEFESIIRDLGLEDVRGRVIATLSRGHRQRVGIAQALMGDPPVLILDEPTLGLDLNQGHDIRQLIRDLSGWKTIILSSNILSEVSEVCDRIAILDKGRLIAIASMKTLMAPYPDRMNIIVKVGSRAADARQEITGVDGVLSVCSLDEKALSVDMVKDESLIPVLASRIVAAGIPLMEIAHREMSLEKLIPGLEAGETGIGA